MKFQKIISGYKKRISGQGLDKNIHMLKNITSLTIFCFKTST